LSSSGKAALVSVVIPSYRHRNFIEEALDSVMVQTYSRIELIVVDDCSPDDTADIAAAWMERPECFARFHDVRLVRNAENLGAHASFNLGIQEAKGEYICLMNSDDYCDSRRVELMMAALTSTGGLIAFSAVNPVGSSGDSLTEGDLVHRIQSFGYMAAGFPSVSFGFMRYNLAVSTGNLFFHRSLFDRIGGFRPLKYCHDWDFILRAIAWAEPVYVPENLYFYRMHETNSFTQLGDVAAIETELSLGRYFQEVLSETITNTLAPSPSNWPGLFELYLSYFGVDVFWQRACDEYRDRRCSAISLPALPGHAGAVGALAADGSSPAGSLREVHDSSQTSFFPAGQANGVLRTLIDLIQQPNLLWRRRLCRFTLMPSGQLIRGDSRPNVWQSVGYDPQFILVAQAGYPRGWTLIHFRMKCNALRVSPRLYLDTGNGFNELESLALPISLKGNVNIIVRLPKNIQLMRFDPLDCEGVLEFDSLLMTEINIFEKKIRMLRRLIPIAIRTWKSRDDSSAVLPRPVKWKDLLFNTERTYYDVSPGVR
jgi:glycosyltransferase involved in cell wall biosynthesis